jgi:hypothetical protein
MRNVQKQQYNKECPKAISERGVLESNSLLKGATWQGASLFPPYSNNIKKTQGHKCTKKKVPNHGQISYVFIGMINPKLKQLA